MADWAVPKAQYAAAAAPPPGMSHTALPSLASAGPRASVLTGDVQARRRLGATLEKLLRVMLRVQRPRVSALPESLSRALRSACCRALWGSW